MLTLESLPPLREIIAEYDLRAQKSLGQNFLLDQNITDKIVRKAGDLTNTTVFEIGSGPGGLTRSLLRAGVKKVIAIEFDSRAVHALENLKEAVGDRLEIIEGDALKINLLDIADGKCAIVANLPYNIATPLIINWLRQIRDIPNAYVSMTVMVQKEVGQRITAQVGGKTYGRLSVLSQWLCNVCNVYDLPPSAFTPPPKVSSSVIHFTPRLLEEEPPVFKTLEQVTAIAFGQRRKMIRSSLKIYKKELEKLGIDTTLRAENLCVQDYINISKAVHKSTDKIG